MNAVRRLLLNRPGLAACLLAVALCVKVLVPGGYMPVVADGRIMVSICSGTAPATAMSGMPGMAGHHAGGPMAHPTSHHDFDGSTEHQKAQTPCAFAGLGSAAVAAIDTVLLATGIAFILALGVAVIVGLPLAAAAHLRPPLRGPPATG